MAMVDSSNAVFAPAISSLTAAADVLAVAAIAAFLIETRVVGRIAPDMVDANTSCLFSVDLGKDVCGEMSFDSSPAMTCVETVDENGNMGWLCA